MKSRNNTSNHTQAGWFSVVKLSHNISGHQYNRYWQLLGHAGPELLSLVYHAQQY